MSFRDWLAEQNPEAVLFEGPEFDAAILGGTATGDVVAVYCVEKILDVLIEVQSYSYSDAMDWFWHNMAPSSGLPGGPVLVYDIAQI